MAASLGEWLAPVTFLDKEQDEVTELLVDSIEAWATGQGWRTYRRAPSVMALPAPFSHQHSWLDLGCARLVGPPLAIEIDRTDRRRTVEKLLAEAEAGRVAIWVRWGSRKFEAPPPPVRMVTFRVTSRSGVAGRGTLYSRQLAPDRPAPLHSSIEVQVDEQTGLFGKFAPTDS